MLPEMLHLSQKNPDQFGQALWDLNIDSVNQRYDENTAYKNYQFVSNECNFEQFVKSLRCWSYQSCEGDCDQRLLFQAVDDFSATMMKLVNPVCYEQAK